MPETLCGTIWAKRWLEDKKAIATSTFEKISIAELVKKLDNSVESILRLMALFIFKTLILPLLFMFSLTWGAKQIWKINTTGLFEKIQNPYQPA